METGGRGRGKPSAEGTDVITGGVGCFVDTTRAESSMIRENKYAIWHRLEVTEGQAPLAVGTVYFPQAQDVPGHVEAHKALCGDLAYLIAHGYRVLLGGDFNAHTGANRWTLLAKCSWRLLTGSGS